MNCCLIGRDVSRDVIGRHRVQAEGTCPGGPFELQTGIEPSRSYSYAEYFPGLIPVLGSQPAGDVSHKPGGRLPLLSARPAVTLATLKRAAASFTAW